MALPLLQRTCMDKNDLKAFFEDLLGDSILRFEQFREDQWAKVEQKLAEIGKRAVQAELQATAQRLDAVERRLSALEAERAEKIQEEL